MELYDRYRPGYPAALLDWLLEGAGIAPGHRVADIGCGTGISTRLLGERGLRVVGVDPNPDMLAAAGGGTGISYVVGEASATGLADRSVRLATAAQAFHWFPLEPTLRELSRILTIDGSCGVFWNDRTSSPFLDEYEHLLREASAEYGQVPRARETLARVEAQSGVRDFECAEFPSAQQLDREGLRGRAFSSSYVAHGVSDLEGFHVRLDELFDRFAEDGVVEFRYSSVVGRFGLDRR